MEIRAATPARSQVRKKTRLEAATGFEQVSFPLSSVILKINKNVLAPAALPRSLYAACQWFWGESVLLLPQRLLPCAGFSVLARSATAYPAAPGSRGQ